MFKLFELLFVPDTVVASDGEIVGIFEGRKEDLRLNVDGILVGSKVGSKVGDDDGSTVGSKVGSKEEDDDGSTLGSAVGSNEIVGDEEGSTVGSVVGPNEIVGEIVGAKEIVGVDVGCTVGTQSLHKDPSGQNWHPTQYPWNLWPSSFRHIGHLPMTSGITSIGSPWTVGRLVGSKQTGHCDPSTWSDTNAIVRNVKW